MSTEEPQQPRKGALHTLRTVAEAIGGILDAKTWIALIVAGILLVVGGLGGLERATAEAPAALPTAKVGEPIEVRPFTITVVSAHQGDSLGKLLTAKKGKRYIAVRLTIVTHEGQSARQGLKGSMAQGYRFIRLQTPGVPEGDKDSFVYGFRVSDSQILATLQPELPTDVLIVFEQDTVEVPTPPSTVTAVLQEQTWRRSNLDGSWGWFDPTPVVTMEIPVKPLKGQQ